MKCLLPLLLILGFSVGCAQKFAYQAPAPKTAPTTITRTLVVAPLADSRTNRSLDKVMVKGFLTEVHGALTAELQSSGLFREVLTNSPTAEWRLEPTLVQLHWYVADYDQKVANAFLSGLAGGLIGGTIYGSMKDNAFGHAEVMLRFTETANGTLVTEKTYHAEHQERLANMSIDSASTQARMARLAFQKAMEQLKADLPTFAQ